MDRARPAAPPSAVGSEKRVQTEKGAPQVRQIRRLLESGRQVPLITTHSRMPVEQIARRPVLPAEFAGELLQIYASRSSISTPSWSREPGAAGSRSPRRQPALARNRPKCQPLPATRSAPLRQQDTPIWPGEPQSHQTADSRPTFSRPGSTLSTPSVRRSYCRIAQRHAAHTITVAELDRAPNWPWIIASSAQAREAPRRSWNVIRAKGSDRRPAPKTAHDCLSSHQAQGKDTATSHCTGARDSSNPTCRQRPIPEPSNGILRIRRSSKHRQRCRRQRQLQWSLLASRTRT